MAQQLSCLDESTLERLSALLDGEASAEDIDQLLDEDLLSLADAAQSLQSVSDAHGESLAFTEMAGRDFLQGVNQRLQLEPDAEFPVSDNVTPLVKVAQPVNRTKQLWWGMGIAASISLVVFAGLNWQEQQDAVPLTAAVQNTPATLSSADHLRLQRYLQQHAQQASLTAGQGMMPMARVVNYSVDE